MVNRLSIEELDRLRDKDGYIDLDKIPNLQDYVFALESMGERAREKDWLHFKHTNVLVKTDECFANSNTYVVYSELIIEELAKQVGFEVAHTDIVKYKGKKGIFSQNILKEGEQLHSLKDYIDEDGIGEGIIDIDIVETGLFNSLKQMDIPKKYMKKAYYDLQKSFVFDAYTLGIDNHLENISYVESTDENGNKILKLSPLYDNEISLGLDNGKETMEKLSNNMLKLSEFVSSQSPVIGIPSQDMESNQIEDNPLFKMLQKDVKKFTTPIWQETLDYICENEEMLKYTEKLYKELNINKAIENVENRINAKIPDIAKEFSTAVFDERKNQIKYYILDMYKEYDVEEKIDGSVEIDNEKDNSR